MLKGMDGKVRRKRELMFMGTIMGKESKRGCSARNEVAAKKMIEMRRPHS